MSIDVRALAERCRSSGEVTADVKWLEAFAALILEEAANEVSKRVICGRAWNEAQAQEAEIVSGCSAAIRDMKPEQS